MGLESTSFIAGLTESWPPTGDPKSQGDDHIRLIKSVLKTTFPSGDRPFYFPKTEAVSSTIVLDATDQNNMLTVDTTAANVAVTLPAALGSGDKGWECEVIKISSDANAAIVSAASGNINSKVGSTATIRVGILCEPARFIWNGTAWYCSKPGPMIGSTESFDGAAVPPGYLLDDGSAYSNTAFAELFAILGTSTLRDKRGRVEAGVDGGVGRLSATHFGASPTLGAVGGLESTTLSLAQLPTGITSNNTTQTINVQPPSGRYVMTSATSFIQDFNPPSASLARASDNTSTMTQAIFTGVNAISVTSNNTGAGAHRTVPPTIVVNKIKRAC